MWDKEWEFNRLELETPEIPLPNSINIMTMQSEEKNDFYKIEICNNGEETIHPSDMLSGYSLRYTTRKPYRKIGKITTENISGDVHSNESIIGNGEEQLKTEDVLSTCMTRSTDRAVTAYATSLSADDDRHIHNKHPDISAFRVPFKFTKFFLEEDGYLGEVPLLGNPWILQDGVVISNSDCKDAHLAESKESIIATVPFLKLPTSMLSVAESKPSRNEMQSKVSAKEIAYSHRDAK